MSSVVDDRLRYCLLATTRSKHQRQRGPRRTVGATLLVVPVALTASPDVTSPGRLRLRRPTPDDLEVVHAIHSDPRTNIHNPAGRDRDRRASQARLTEWLEHWDEHGFGYQVVELTEQPMSVIGFTGAPKHLVRRARAEPLLPLRGGPPRPRLRHRGRTPRRHLGGGAPSRHPSTCLHDAGQHWLATNRRGRGTATTAAAGAPVARAVLGRAHLDLADRDAVAGSPSMDHPIPARATLDDQPHGTTPNAPEPRSGAESRGMCQNRPNETGARPLPSPGNAAST